jgi:hypothetical protein
MGNGPRSSEFVSRKQPHPESEAVKARTRGDLDSAASDQHSVGALSQRSQLLLSLQRSAGNRAVAQQLQGKPRRNETGLPDDLKSGVESLSGVSLDGVRVHYGSSQPAQLNALAYAQGSDIHVAPGQERHLPHEAWHVVQQAEGRVPATGQLESGVAVNDDEGLEHEADAMGTKASVVAVPPQPAQRTSSASNATAAMPVQRVLAHNGPIVATEVTAVTKVGKLVFILKGQGKDSIVVKFESMGSEPEANYKDRSAALRAIAFEVLKTCRKPGYSTITT